MSTTQPASGPVPEPPSAIADSSRATMQHAASLVLMKSSQVAGTAVSIGAAPIVAIGAVIGLAGYGIYRIFK